MTAETQERERQARISAQWAVYPHYHYSDVVAQVDAELQAEADQQAEGKVWVDDMVQGMARRAACGACGQHRGLGEQTGYCAACRGVAAQILAERRGADIIAGRSRRELVEAYLDRKGG